MIVNKPDFSKLNAVFVSTKDASLQAPALYKLKEILDRLNLKMLLEKHSQNGVGVGEFYETDEIFKRTNLIISLGGDGNYIGTCRRFAKKNAFVVGIHTGRLGFLTDTLLQDCENFLKEILAGNFALQKIRFLKADFKGKKSLSKLAFNDIALCRKSENCSAHIEAFLDEVNFNSYYGDGVIIASPMGSTAYNMSAGGAIIHPDSKAFCLTPICSHSLTQRPLIMPENSKIKFSSKDDISVVVDGQINIDLKEFECVEISFVKQKICLIRSLRRNYFSVLKEKLRWGN